MKLIKYSAKTWHCPSCIQLSKLLDSVDLKDIEFLEIDIDSLKRQEMQDLKIRGVPVLRLLSDEGEEVKRMTGVPTKQQLEEFLGLA